MPSLPSSPADATLEALGYALFAAEGDTLRLTGTPPSWLRALWPNLKARGAKLSTDASPFLENFLIDAAKCWKTGGETRQRSGPWVETDPKGESVQVEATALTVDGRPLLLIKRLGEEFESRKAILQKARERVVGYQRLSAEMQKKELLLHYVADDMSNALGNIITSLRLVELEQNPLRMRKLLDLAGQAARQQQNLIQRILGSFAGELEDLYGKGDHLAQADVHSAVHLAAEGAGPNFADKRVGLDVPTDFLSASPTGGEKTLRAAIDPVRLERVVANLLEVALHSTPAGGRVAVRIDEETETVRIRVEDGGTPLPQDLREQLFGDAAPLPPQSPTTELRLNYCRLSVENNDGEIGCDQGETSGNSFWVRLPKISSL